MNKNSSSSGLGISSVLTIIFVVLKLVGVINWSWWWVLSPTLIAVGLWLIAVITLAIIACYWNKKRGFIPRKGKRDKWKF